MVLSMVVLGGMGSVLGVTIAAAILVLAPEYLRASPNTVCSCSARSWSS